MKFLPARNIDSRDVEGIVWLKLRPMCMASESHSAITVEEKDCFPKRNLVKKKNIIVACIHINKILQFQ